MTHDYPVERVPATPEYVLAVIDTAFRTWSELNRVSYEPIPPTLEMTVEAWLKQFGSMWRLAFRANCAEWLNTLFDLDLPDDEWERFLLWNNRVNMSDLCQFVASQLKTREVIRPWQSLMGECRPAGAFLTFKSMLAAAGTDVSDFAPSTPLADARFGKRLLGILNPLIRLAPETFPSGFKIECPRKHKWLGLCFIILGFGLFLGGLVAPLAVFGKPSVTLSVCGFILFLATAIFAIRTPMWPVVPGMTIYADLAYAIAGQQPRRRKQSLT
jgi:hypothetical protein